MSEAISAYVRGSTFLPPILLATVDWYQGWDPSGKGWISRFEMVFNDAYTKRVLQRLIQRNS